jgi:hypothetical protein
MRGCDLCVTGRAGDNPVTAASIARQCGILAADAELPSLAALSDGGEEAQARALNGAGASSSSGSSNGAGPGRGNSTGDGTPHPIWYLSLA